MTLEIPISLRPPSVEGVVVRSGKGEPLAWVPVTAYYRRTAVDDVAWTNGTYLRGVYFPSRSGPSASSKTDGQAGSCSSCLQAGARSS